MTLNVNPERSTPDAPDGGPDRTVRVPADELLDELAGWGARDRLRMFTAWHRGSLSLVHLSVIALLETQGPLPMNAIAEALDVSQASATGIIDRMEERGLVERGRDETDRRVILIRLAEAGTAVTSEMLEQRRTRLRRVLAELSPDEVAGFLKGIRAMRAARERLLAQTGEGQEP